MSLPKRVLLREDGPREGFQILERVVPTKQKLELINALSETGITSIEVTAFVRPDRVPQHADAEQVATQLKTVPGVRYRGLYLNEQGLERAMRCRKLDVEGYLMIAPSESFLKKNNNCSIDQAIAAIPEWIKKLQAHGRIFERLMCSTAFGDLDEGKKKAEEVLNICTRAIEKIDAAGAQLEEVTFADTTGFASPESVRRLVGGFRSHWPQIAVGLHLHDTRGSGMANVYAGLLEGVDRFDCSVAGLGGCPFTEGAAGNVPTEDVAFLCEEIGVATGLNLPAYIECAKLAERIVGHQLPGKLKQGGML